MKRAPATTTPRIFQAPTCDRASIASRRRLRLFLRELGRSRRDPSLPLPSQAALDTQLPRRPDSALTIIHFASSLYITLDLTRMCDSDNRFYSCLPTCGALLSWIWVLGIDGMRRLECRRLPPEPEYNKGGELSHRHAVPWSKLPTFSLITILCEHSAANAVPSILP